MRVVFVLLLSSAVSVTTLLPQDSVIGPDVQPNDNQAPQDLTIAPGYNLCRMPSGPEAFGYNGLTDYICKPYIEAVLHAGLGLRIPYVVTEVYWYSPWEDAWRVYTAMDREVREKIQSISPSNGCDVEQKTWQICSLQIPACYAGGDDGSVFFDTIPVCRQSCEYISGCTLQDCSQFDKFNESDTRNCIPLDEQVASSSQLSMLVAFFASLL